MEAGIIISIGKQELKDIISAAVQAGIDQYNSSTQEGSEVLQDRKKFLKYKEAADYLDMSISKLRTLVAQGKIPYYQDERLIYFLQDELEGWLLSLRKSTTKENELTYEEKLNNFFNKKRK